MCINVLLFILLFNFKCSDQKIEIEIDTEEMDEEEEEIRANYLP